MARFDFEAVASIVKARILFLLPADKISPRLRPLDCNNIVATNSRRVNMHCQAEISPINKGAPKGHGGLTTSHYYSRRSMYKTILYLANIRNTPPRVSTSLLLYVPKLVTLSRASSVSSNLDARDPDVWCGFWRIYSPTVDIV